MSNSVEKTTDKCDRAGCNRFGMGTMYYALSALSESCPVLFVCDQCAEESAQEIRGDESEEDDDLPF
jgi:hypothetical protein